MEERPVAGAALEPPGGMGLGAMADILEAVSLKLLTEATLEASRSPMLSQAMAAMEAMAKILTAQAVVVEAVVHMEVKQLAVQHPLLKFGKTVRRNE